MKKYKNIVFAAIILILTISTVYSKTLPLLGKTIYIDPGHGGKDPGAMYKDIKESDLNLLYSKVIGKKLEESGATVYYTRDDDYDLSISNKRRKKSDLYNRVSIINNSKVDLYLSIHMNSESTGIFYGPQIFYNNINKNNKIIAKILEKHLKKEKLSNRKSSLIKDAYMYNNIKIPGVLIEVGFLSNSSDRYKLVNEEYSNRFSITIVNSIIEYFNNK